MYVSISLHEIHSSNWLEGMDVGFQSHRAVQTGQEDKAPDIR